MPGVVKDPQEDSQDEAWRESEDDKVEEGFAFSMSVTRIKEAPRVTKPYTEEQWAAINSLGKRIDMDHGRPITEIIDS